MVGLDQYPKISALFDLRPYHKSAKYGPNPDDVSFMNTCRRLTSVSTEMSNDPSIMRGKRWRLKPCPVEEIVAPTSMKGMLELQYLKYLTFECKFSAATSGDQCWEAAKELVDWFVAELRKLKRTVEVAARRIDMEGAEVDAYAPM